MKKMPPLARPSRTVQFLFLIALGILAGQSWRSGRLTPSCGLFCAGSRGLFAQNDEAGGMAPAPPAVEKAGVPLETDFSLVSETLAQALPAMHLLRQAFDEVKSSQAWTNYLVSLDVERAYFRQEDIEAFEPQRLKIGDALQTGDVSFATQVYEKYLERVKERVLFAEHLLAEPFDFEVEESYQWRRRDAPWCATREEQDDLWRRRVKNEVLARIINQELKAGSLADENAGRARAEEKDGEAVDVPEDAEPETEAEKESNEQFVLKRYQRYLTVLEDNDDEATMSRYLNAVAMAYDPHTSYLSPVSLEDFGINMQLSLQGVGAQLRPEDGTARVVEIIPGGPADRDTREIRLMPGDRIIGVGQGDEPVVDTMHWPLYKTVRLIRGPKGTKVVLLLQSASDPSGNTTRLLDLVRDDVRLEEQAATSSVETVNDSGSTERKLGIIRLPTFYASMNANGDAERRSAALDIARLLAELNTQNIEGLVLDLRGNGGGSLKEAIDLVGLFIQSGPVVLVKERTRIHTLADQDPAIAFRKPVVVLIDRISASASEIVAGALQDYGRAIVVGDSRSHGKGTVQQVLPLDDSGKLGSIKVTNASFYRINGNSTQSRGVDSDIVVPSAFDFFADLGEDKLPNAIPWSTVRPSHYRVVADLGPTIGTLRQRSEERLGKDERWQRHARRLQRIERIQNLREIPLHIEQRRAFARDERELESLEDDLSDEGTTRKDRAAARRANDVVLDEGLRILVDFIDVHGPLTGLSPASTAPSGTDNLFERFFR